jgi:hypothetical protein
MLNALKLFALVVLTIIIILFAIPVAVLLILAIAIAFVGSIFWGIALLIYDTIT